MVPFKSHKHCSHTWLDLNPGVFTTTRVSSPSADESLANSQEEEFVDDANASSDLYCTAKGLATIIEERCASSPLKLEHLVHVPSSAIDEFLRELHHFIFSAPVPLSGDYIIGSFHQHNLQVDDRPLKNLFEIGVPSTGRLS